MRISLRALAIAVVASFACAVPAAADPPPAGDYGENDYGGFLNVMPPGQNGFASLFDIGAFFASGARPAHSNDQLPLYSGLVYEGANVSEAEVGEFFKDASFGIPPTDTQTVTNPNCDVVSEPSPDSEHCDDVTIVRDGSWSVPHIYGANRAALMFGIGYATAQDRMFTMDVQRHAGRAELSSFLGGSNAGADREIWRSAPYTEEDLELQFDRIDDLYGPDGAQVQADVINYTDGVNQYIAEARVGPPVNEPGSRIPGEYNLIGQPSGPEPWRVTDVISVASLVAGIFGKGGGGEIQAARALQAAIARYGDEAGRRVWEDFRSQNDPEAPTTVQGQEFPYLTPPENPEGVALPDPGTLQREPIVAESTAGRVPASKSVIGPLLRSNAASNALLVSSAESETGNALTVMGPQVGYYTPGALIEQDIHAPAGAEGPAIDARGTGFAGANLYVQLGRGQDYVWSATSAGQDIIDTFAVPLCEPDESEPTLESSHYLFDGECLPFEEIERENSWTPSLADQTPAGSETLVALRTKLGLVTHRALIGGEPYAYTELRATYFHEADSAVGFADFNSPDRIENAGDFAHAASKIDYTFNWFYADDDDIAYFNSGANPVRANGTDANLPILGAPELLWEGFDPEDWTFQRAPVEEHPQVLNQPYITSWNNKQAPGYSASDDTFSYGPVQRVKTLNDRIEKLIAGTGKASRAELVGAMNDAATVDLRGDAVLPWALRVLRSGKKPIRNKKIRKAIKQLQAWRKAGAHRRDLNGDGKYERTRPIRLMDAWWPRLVRAQFRPALGGELYDSLVAVMGLDDKPGPNGSAYNNGWYGYVQKDLRSVLRRPVDGAWSRKYCGNGKLKKCRNVLKRTLGAAIRNSKSPLFYGNGCVQGSPQWCNDAIRHTVVGAIGQPPIHWVNRPTFQQVTDIQGGR